MYCDFAPVFRPYGQRQTVKDKSEVGVRGGLNLDPRREYKFYGEIRYRVSWLLRHIIIGLRYGGLWAKGPFFRHSAESGEIFYGLLCRIFAVSYNWSVFNRWNITLRERIKFAFYDDWSRVHLTRSRSVVGSLASKTFYDFILIKYGRFFFPRGKTASAKTSIRFVLFATFSLCFINSHHLKFTNPQSYPPGR